MKATRSDAPVVARPINHAERQTLKLNGIQWCAAADRRQTLWIRPPGIVCLGAALYARMQAPRLVKVGYDPVTRCLVVQAHPEVGIVVSKLRKGGTVEIERRELQDWLVTLSLTRLDPVAPKWDVEEDGHTLWFFEVPGPAQNAQ